MAPELLELLREYFERRGSIVLWRKWWTLHEAEFARQGDRFAFLRLKHRGLQVLTAVLEENGIALAHQLNACRGCGQSLLAVRPGRTVAEEIRAFENGDRSPRAEDLGPDEYTRTIKYCPNACTIVRPMPTSDLWESINQDYDAAHRVRLIVVGDVSLLGGIAAYKLYVNGYIHQTSPRWSNEVPVNSVCTRLRAGVHRIILRDYEVRRPDRRESNALEIALRDEESCSLRAGIVDGQLRLSVEASPS